jgi:NAD(P)-dependent dehydrogenase (short-subunit alcohol dehydrogenase family)
MSKPKTALVTGANKGIGFATVQALAEAGYRVWLAARESARGEAAVAALRAQALDVHFLLLDVTSEASVQQAAAALAAQTDSLDVLINNAGINLSPDDRPSTEPLASIRQVYEVNTFGPIRVTQAFLPLLRAAGSARVVMVSSIVGSLALSSDQTTIYGQVNFMGYSSSKAALNGITVAFAKELEPLGIKVNAIEPGHIDTDLNRHTGTKPPEEGANVVVRYAMMDDAGPTGGFFGSQGALPW